MLVVLCRFMILILFFFRFCLWCLVRVSSVVLLLVFLMRMRVCVDLCM